MSDVYHPKEDVKVYKVKSEWRGVPLFTERTRYNCCHHLHHHHHHHHHHFSHNNF